MAKQLTFAYSISKKTQDEMIEYFEFKKRDKTPPYAIFQADEEDTVVTLYESGKVVFQGVSADIDANMWKEREKMNTGSYPKEKEKKNDDKKDKVIDTTDYYYINSIGSDEVGTGDFFGPVVVTASYVNKKDIPFLEELGVKDSKKLTDEKIIKIAPEIIKRIPHSTIILSNEEYNNVYSSSLNLNKIKAVLHNKALYTLMQKDTFDYEKIVIDEFENKYAYYKHLEGTKYKVKNATFTTKAEDKCLSVACSSIICRYVFINEMNKLSKKYNINIPYGASPATIDTALKIKNEYGINELNKLVKTNFKNMEKIKE